MLTSLPYKGRDFAASDVIAGIACSAAQIQNNRKDHGKLLPQQDALVIAPLHGHERLADTMTQVFKRMHAKTKHLRGLAGTTGTMALWQNGKLMLGAIGDSPAYLKIEDSESCYMLQVLFPDNATNYVKDGITYTSSIVLRSDCGIGAAHPGNTNDAPIYGEIDVDALARKLIPSPKGNVTRTLVIASDGILTQRTLSEPVQNAMANAGDAKTMASAMVEAKRHRRSMWRMKTPYRDHVTVTACDLPEHMPDAAAGLCMAVFDGHGPQGDVAAQQAAQTLAEYLQERQLPQVDATDTKWSLGLRASQKNEGPAEGQAR